MKKLFCSMCGKSFDPDLSVTMPFCSERCQHLDLAGWLDEKYGLPYEGDERPEAEIQRQQEHEQSEHHDFR